MRRRKNWQKFSKKVQKQLWWIEWTVMTCMAITAVCSLASTYSSLQVIKGFDNCCMYTSGINFTRRTNLNSSAYNNYIKEFNTTFNEIFDASTETPTTTPLSTNETRKVKNHIYSFFNIQKAERSGIISEPDEDMQREKTEITSDDYWFLTTMKIDKYDSFWAHRSLCDYSLYFPIWSAVVAIFWNTMLLVHAFGRKHNLEKRLPRPWRIVLPTIITFLIMSILAILYNLIIESGYSRLCKGLSEPLQTKDIDCKYLIDAFYLSDTKRSLKLGIFYSLHKMLSRFTTVIWIVALLVMAARCFCVTDFQMVHMIKRTITPTASKQPTELSSKDDLDDFQSAYSEPDILSVDDDSHPSMKPLISSC